MKNTFLMKRILVIAALTVASHCAVDAFVWHKAVDPRCVSQGLWDFSNIDTEQVTNISFKTIGCNLIAETLDGRRYWYSICDDSVSLVKEETALFSISYPQAIHTSAIHPQIGSSNDTELQCIGNYTANTYVAEELRYRSTASAPCRIVTGINDTIPTFMTAEFKTITAKLSNYRPTFPLDVQADTLSTYDITRYRWYVADITAPIAYLTTIVERDPNGVELNAQTIAYIVDFTDVDIDTTPSADIQSILENVCVTVSSGHIIVSISSEDQIHISIGVSTPSGIGYYANEYDIDGETNIEVPTNGMPSGQYVVGIYCGNNNEKRFVTI